MDKLFENISELLNKDVKIEIYSSLNQHLVDRPNIVLWDRSTVSISDSIYQKLKDATSKKVCTFYNINKVLPYHDFCIALLCSVGYTLNHNTIPKVQARSFKSAWRLLSILVGIADKELQEWIKDRIQDRDAIKYCLALGLNDQDSPTVSRKMSFSKASTRFTVDDDILSKACSSKNVKEITYNTPGTISTVINKVTTTPEGQLDNLRIIHKELLNNSF